MIGRFLPRSLQGPVGRVALRARNLAARRLQGRPLAEVHWPFLELGEAERHIFFGYYDITPMSADGRHLLAHCLPANAADPARHDIKVGLFTREGAGWGRFRPLASTALWCWQMGARLRWLDGERVLFNAMVDGGYGARILGMDGTPLATLPRPLFDVTRDGAMGLSLNFARLQRLRPGYGYARLPDPSAGQNCPADDGVSILDLSTPERPVGFLSLPDAAAVDPRPGMAEAEHYFNHASWAPGGQHFALFHLWQRPGGGRAIRLLIVDRSGRITFSIPGQDHISHMAWLDDRTILAFARLPGDKARAYQIIDLERASWRAVAPERLEVDGHPNPRPGAPDTFLSDAYPDRTSYRRLYIFDMASGQREEIGRFHSPLDLRGERRCDLHPRWSPDGRQVIVDSAHSGLRRMVVIKMDRRETPA